MDSEKPTSLRSRLLTRLAGLLGACILYLLSIGPAGYVCIRADIEPAILRNFYIPAAWISENTPLRQPMRRYIMWWSTRAFVHRNRQWPQTTPERPMR